ncbi:MAG TPA: hypothetical protein VMF61_13995 [Candidatus Acidoferrales bacterium]|nr:hypothetical protein [Candidatus Acidoferrales bacterium]
MPVGRELLDLWRASGARSLFVVGIGKNVGKTVTMRAVYDAAGAGDATVGLTSIGRDGEASDAGDGAPKPRLWLRPKTVVATARDVLPRSPASELLDLLNLPTAAGDVLLARVAQPAYYELVGPPTASGVRRCVDALLSRCDLALVDGAIDRVAALAGGRDAIVVAAGAASADSMNDAVEQVRALVQRLGVPQFDPHEPFRRVDGALTPALAADLIAAREPRQIVVRDPTQIALSGKAASHALERLRLRCERPLHAIAATIASIGRERTFEPKAFARAVAAATGLPTFDVYAETRAA